MVDPSGHIPLLAVLAIAGAALGFGLATYADYQADGVYFNGNIGNYLSYTLDGAFIGGVLGAGIGAFFAGSFFASMSAVKTGVLLTGGLIRAGGFGAAGMMMYDNFRNALHYSTHIFWSGSELSKNAAEYLAGNTGGITLEMTKLGQYLSNLPDLSREVWSIASANFANQVHNGSTIFVVHNSMGVGIDSIWAKIEFPILIKKNN